MPLTGPNRTIFANVTIVANLFSPAGRNLQRFVDVGVTDGIRISDNQMVGASVGGDVHVYSSEDIDAIGNKCFSADGMPHNCSIIVEGGYVETPLHTLGPAPIKSDFAIGRDDASDIRMVKLTGLPKGGSVVGLLFYQHACDRPATLDALDATMALYTDGNGAPVGRLSPVATTWGACEDGGWRESVLSAPVLLTDSTLWLAHFYTSEVWNTLKTEGGHIWCHGSELPATLASNDSGWEIFSGSGVPLRLRLKTTDELVRQLGPEAGAAAFVGGAAAAVSPQNLLLVDRGVLTNRNATRSASLQVAQSSQALPIASVNVRSFGARGDGQHDDSGAFTRAIAKASAAASGCFADVIVPPGTYIVRNVTLRPQIMLRGVVTDADADGMRPAIVLPYTDTVASINMLSDTFVTGLTFRAAHSNAAGVGAYTEGGIHAGARCAKGVQWPQQAADCHPPALLVRNVTVSDCVFEGGGGQRVAVLFENLPGPYRIARNDVSNWGLPILMNMASRGHVLGNVVRNSTTQGIQFSGWSSHGP
jgi:hypothetical protein